VAVLPVAWLAVSAPTQQASEKGGVTVTNSQRPLLQQGKKGPHETNTARQAQAVAMTSKEKE
jgi:hypothetical protein